MNAGLRWIYSLTNLLTACIGLHLPQSRGGQRSHAY